MSNYTGQQWTAIWIDESSMITARAWRQLGRRTVRWRGKKFNYRRMP